MTKLIDCLTFGLVRADALGWTSLVVLGALGAGLVPLGCFVAWELRIGAPMLPMRFFANRTFSATNAVSLAMYFAMFGAIFLLAEFFQTVQGYSPLASGIRILPWTAMPLLVALIAGLLSDRVGSRPLMFAGLALPSAALAWLAAVASPTMAYASAVGPFLLAGSGMALVFAPAASAVLSAVRAEEAGQARPGPPTRSARPAACSGSPCWRRSSLGPAATLRRTRSSTA